MYLSIDGDINAYYVQMLCMVYFPGAKFAADAESPDTLPAVHLRLRDGDGTAEADVHIACTEGEADGHGSVPVGGDRARAAKFAAGRAFIDAGEKLFGSVPPWGMLTGVRPSKLALDCLEKGLDRDATEQFLHAEYLVSPKKASLVTTAAMAEREILTRLGRDTLSLYVSIPFCPTRCAYCSFVSYSTKRLLSLIPEYLVRLEKDLRAAIALARELGQKIVTVYIGGGTPGILTADQLSRLLSVIADGCPDLLEFNYEAGRPDTVTAEKLKAAKEYGVTRVSINPQTLSDDVLEAIGRRHTAAQFLDAYDVAAASGIPHINTDLIAGLPGDDFPSFTHSMDTILGLAPDNITVHTFCVKKSADILREGSTVYSRSGGDAGKSVDYSQLAALNAGYRPYYLYRQKNTVGNFENVGFAKPGAEGLYNVFIMEEVHSILAVGAGAVTKCVSRDRKDLLRLFMPKYPYEYLEMQEGAYEEHLGKIREFYASRW